MAQDWQIYDGAGHRKYLSEEEVPHFLHEADRLPDARRALCYLVAHTGCRISEALAVTLPQVDPVDGAIVLATLKRRRVVYRRVPLPDYLLRMLLALPAQADGCLWRFHRATAWRFITDAMQRAGIHGVQATIRGLRHGFGMRCATQGVPPSLIQRWMGHASLRMTMVYLDATGTEERRFASRVWWPVGALEKPGPSTMLTMIAPEVADSADLRQIRQENDRLRQENARLRQLCDAVLRAVQPFSGSSQKWRRAC